MTTINIAKDFARYPFGRYRSDGPYSGERFRQEFLEEKMRTSDDEVVVILDGASGLGSSFLDEAFGGLVRAGFDKVQVLRRIRIVSQDSTRYPQIKRYIEEASAQQARARA